MSNTTLFQYCQKLIVLSSDLSSVLLAKRVGEADYDQTYTFIGGKLETTDADLTAGMKREKDEEIGSSPEVQALTTESHNILYRKQDGNSMVIAHVACIYQGGDVVLSDEYTDYKWVPLDELEQFEPKIQNITMFTRWAKQKLATCDPDQLATL